MRSYGSQCQQYVDDCQFYLTISPEAYRLPKKNEHLIKKKYLALLQKRNGWNSERGKSNNSPSLSMVTLRQNSVDPCWIHPCS